MDGSQRRLAVREIPLPKLVEAVSFWSAIALPFVYLPLLVAGLETVNMQVLFTALVALNGVAILLGHQYGR